MHRETQALNNPPGDISTKNKGNFKIDKNNKVKVKAKVEDLPIPSLILNLNLNLSLNLEWLS